jgi:hypothetical protein
MIGYSENFQHGQSLKQGDEADFLTRWGHLHKHDPFALPTQTPEWFTAVSDLKSRNASRFYTLPSGQQLFLPLLKSSLWQPLTSAGSMPQHWGYGGLLSSQPLTAVDVQHVWQDLRQLGWQTVRVRPNPLQAEAWENGRISQVQSIPRTAHVLDLRAGFDAVWDSQFKSSMRRNVRKAEKSGLTVTCDTTGQLLPAFYDLFEASVVRWAAQQHEPTWLAKWRSQQRDPISKFQKIMKRMNGMAKLWIAKLDDQPVAAILVLQSHNAHYTRGVMNKALASKTRANEYLHFNAIKDACQSGCAAYHMGETGNSNSLAQFKEKFGARAVPYAEYFLERLPLTAVEARIKTAIKQVINFKDTN